MGNLTLKDRFRAALPAIAAGTATACLFAFFGFLLLKRGHLGNVLFLYLPIASGFAVAMAAYPPSVTWAIVIIMLLSGIIGLIAYGLEGWLCCLLALPMIAPGLAIGVLIGSAVRKIMKLKSVGKIAMIALPLILLLGMQRAEAPALRNQRVESVTSSILLTMSPAEAWRRIQSFDRMHGEKPFLMQLGLPEPVRCEMIQEGIDGRRVCFFKNGEIQEQITEWNPPYAMGLKITRSTLPGRHWLRFVDARYDLIPEGEGTRLNRTTRISSELRPSWYWRRMERWGVELEHGYILQQLDTKAEQ